MDSIMDSYHFLDRISSQYSTRTAFTYLKNKTLCDVTYSEFFHHVKMVAEQLSGIIENEKRIAIIAENSYAWMIYYWGTMLLGKSAILVDPEMDHDEITNRLRLFDIHFICVGENSLECNDMKVIRMEVPDSTAAVSLDCRRYETQNQEAAEAAILFSSGTTGDYKAVRLSQKNVVSAFIPNTIEYARTVFLPLPFFHSLTINCLITAMMCGCRIYIGSGIKYVLKDLQVFEPELICVTPVYINMFYQRLQRHAEDSNMLCKLFGKNLRYILTGGASPQQKVLDALRAKGIRILSSYGSSETFCIASGEIVAFENCAGILVPHMTVQFENGEIVVKGPTVFMGYFGVEDTSDGWYHTGDLGYLDDSGRLFLSGRNKNLIILS
ncbi:MAG: class I adenylate-forming enzyme family protein, partial [Eubacteriales bacterium]|nr:class I adenylate-forming enzyme family protein [Eubacteriales bacterium]